MIHVNDGDGWGARYAKPSMIQPKDLLNSTSIDDSYNSHAKVNYVAKKMT
jgi:hypothetical protein